ncbi:RING finger protein [Tundrisphaera sp. TA3]|uniref:RING finger protein n=1 Tax=Tundrisphaera sp. TA3 TaxID=3435775 RepID=UPI003EC15369
MGWIVLIVFIALAYAFVRVCAKVAGGIAGTRFRAYRQLAAQYRGKYENRGMSDPPTVSFTHHGALVRVGLAPIVPGQPTIPRTRVVVRFARGLPFRLELAPVGRPSPAQPPKGTRPIRVGDSEFDRGFVVQANDPEMARDFLVAPVRWAIANLQRLGPPGGMLVSINPERMLVQVDTNLGLKPELLAAGVREALALHDGLQAGVAARIGEGVAIVDAGPAAPEDAGPPICKVCGVEIGDDPRVVCTACRTPHHRDCWEFIGACSIFGCKGKSCVPG